MKFFTNNNCQNQFCRNFRISIADCEIKNQKLYYKNRFFLFLTIMIWNSQFVFSKIRKTDENICIDHSSLFVQWNKFVTQFVKDCPCLFKILSFHGTIQWFFEIFANIQAKLEKISINFVSNLPKINDFDVILIIIYRFFK